MVNDGHDTSIEFLGDWVDYWLTPLLANPAFNDNRTLILLTFDENEGALSLVVAALAPAACPARC